MSTDSNYNSGRDSFIVASLVCAALSLVTSCMIFPAILFGCLGILFALLSRRRNDGRLANEAKFTIVFSCLGLFTGIFVTLVSLPNVWKIIHSDEYMQWISSLLQTGEKL